MALTKVTKELIQGGLGIDWQAAVKTGNFQSVASQGYFVNTTSNEVTVTMPPSPAVGDIVSIVDYAGTAQTNNIKITAQANINGSANDVKIDYQRGAVSIIYSGTAQGWLAEYAANDGTNALVNSPSAFNADVLIVAGGGGTTTLCGSGGGGGGGILSGTLIITPTVGYSIQVGAGGTGSTGPGYTTGYTNGVNSFLDASGAGGNTLTANGGGYSAGAGGSFSGGVWPTSGNAGGSGGGGGGYQGNGSNTTGGATDQTSISPLTGYGFAGGSMVSTSPADYVGAGGGGAGGVGQDVNNSNNAGGNGGVGHISTIITTTMASANSIGEVDGSDVYFAGGGGGKGTSGGTGGLGGGANSSSNGTAATGGGGGGATCANSGGGHTGGSGVFIVKYPNTITCTLSGATGLTEIVDTTSISNFKVSMFKVTSEGTNGTGTITFS